MTNDPMAKIEVRSNCKWVTDRWGGNPAEWHDPCPSCLSYIEEHGSSIYPGDVAPADWLNTLLNEDWILELLRERDGLRLSFILEWIHHEGTYDDYLLCEQRQLAHMIRFGLGTLAEDPEWDDSEKPRPELLDAVNRHKWYLKGPIQV
jgi:hypothetical protein